MGMQRFVATSGIIIITKKKFHDNSMVKFSQFVSIVNFTAEIARYNTQYNLDIAAV